MKSRVFLLVPAILLSFVLAGGFAFAIEFGDPCDADATCAPLGADYECIGGDSDPSTGVGGNSGFCGIPAPEGPQTGGAVLQIIQNIANWVFAFFLAVALIFLIWGAFEFVLGQGDPQKISDAKRRLLWAVIGIGLALLANGADDVLRSILL